MPLLLEADPSEEMINGYIKENKVFNAELDGLLVATYVLTQPEASVYEVKNIAVALDHRGKGIGTSLLHHAIEQAKLSGATSIRICTGNTSIQQLNLYQKVGFQITDRIANFFTDNYPEPIWENGQQCRDLVVLSMSLA